MNLFPKKIAVLGGGVSAITSVLELTSEENWKSKYDITVYQLGWRLGGKCASGRNTDIGSRIEEHGLHLWFGFYDNAFKLIQDVYAENNRPQTMPLSTWQEALKPYNFAVLEEFAKDWFGWPILFPTNDLIPGSPDDQPSVLQMIHRMAVKLHEYYGSYFSSLQLQQIPEHQTHQSLLEAIARNLENDFRPILEGVEDIGIKALACIINKLERLLADLSTECKDVVIELVEKFLASLWARIEADIEKNPAAVEFWIIFDLSLSSIKGMFRDKVFSEGYDVINDIDFKAWLRRNQASELAVESALVQCLYSLIFAGRDNYTFEAGTALRGAIMLGLHYKGSFYYRMQAGMGDTIFAPIYEVLKKRGVVFKFFHKVNELQLSEDKNSVQRILIGKQAQTLDAEYQPLITVKALPCWPSYPNYNQLKEGQTLKALAIDLESPWSNWSDVESITLEKGVDFDIVLFGISIGSIPFLCKEILQEKEKFQKWRDMVNNVVAIPTQALQLWLKPDVSALGWKYSTRENAIFGTYIEPYDTYANMDDLLIRECWDGQMPAMKGIDENHWPNHLAYFCGPLFNIEMQPYSDHSFPAEILKQAKEQQVYFLNNLSWRFWPLAVGDNNTGFKWDLLIDLNQQKAEDRLNSQYSRVNISPSELYVLSVVNSSKFRLEPDETECDNLYITGDWINTGINAGCVEASVIAGKKTARAISGNQYYIKWEQDLIKK